MFHEVIYEADPDGTIYIPCPSCLRRQELPQTEEWYEVGTDGDVFPGFVCMAENRKCDFMGHVKILNW